MAQIDSLIGPAALWQERRAAAELRASLDQSSAVNDALSLQLSAKERSPAPAAAEAESRPLPAQTAAGAAASEEAAAALQEKAGMAWLQSNGRRCALYHAAARDLLPAVKVMLIDDQVSEASLCLEPSLTGVELAQFA